MFDRYKSFTVMILKISRAIQRIKSEEIAEYRLKSPHVSCIYYLYKEDGLTATALCDISGEDKSYISHSIRYLEENGFIFCKSNATKRYNARLFLTEKGKEVGRYVTEKIDAILEQSSKGMSAEELDTFYRCLYRIGTNLERICGNYDHEPTTEGNAV